MEIETDPLEGSSYDLGVTVKAEIKEEDEDDNYNTIVADELVKHRPQQNLSRKRKKGMKSLDQEQQDPLIQMKVKKETPDHKRSQMNALKETLERKRSQMKAPKEIPERKRSQMEAPKETSERKRSQMEAPKETSERKRSQMEAPKETSERKRSQMEAPKESPERKRSRRNESPPKVPCALTPDTPALPRLRVLQSWELNAMALERLQTPALLELAQCVQTNQEPIEFNSTDAMMDPKTGLMICLHCLEDFDSNLLSDHMINAHNYRRVLLKCHVCQNTFQERKLLMVHRQECQPEQKVRKRKTFQQIMREVEAKYFMEEQDLLETVSCPICLLELPKFGLKEHLLNEHRKPDVIMTCARCNRNFKSQLTLREHVKLVHEAVEDSEECELCGQKFRSLKYLANHKRNVHPSGNKIHKCLVCGKEFKSRLCLHQHSKYVHPPESASVECPHCPGKRFKSRINLTQHLKVSHGWKRK